MFGGSGESGCASSGASYDPIADEWMPMLWEGEPLPEVKAVLLQKGILVMVFNPCGNRPAEGDFMDVMKTNIQTLRGALYH